MNPPQREIMSLMKTLIVTPFHLVSVSRIFHMFEEVVMGQKLRW
ncbi:hypothetical protein T03_14937 [Trichinella britovi]|uniref:Uncharacterized protein n=1 Tax=Trichinella britovi TaxID=45882 RepID=A0A0V1C9P4_TRIBR|nr:hypothetical protein T03_14937 [Trichinella britovi]